MRRMRLKTILTLIFALMVALTVLMVSICSGIFINRQFEEYVKESQQRAASELAESIGSNYEETHGGFNIDYVHGMGMYALREGFIIRLYDKDMNPLWDAENHDMERCHEVMDGIMLRMKEKKPELKGEFVTYSYDLKSGEKLNGVLEISYYTPFYLNENEFQFIQALNRILAIVGIVSTVLAAFLGLVIAARITSPISGVITATRKISEGDYNVRVDVSPKVQETYELSDAVNTMAGTLKEQEYLRKQMTADIAHELRTPVTNISSYIEMMIEDIMEPTRDRLKSCYDELLRLSGLITDLERLETAESKEIVLEKEDINLYSLSESILQGFSKGLHDKKITSRLEGYEVHVLADKGRIGQVVSNLLSNAIKYTDENGSINILVEKDMNNAVLVVEDTGIGISKEDQMRVFERFYRTDKSRTRKTGGAGIGLTITKAIVQAHGGTIRCESEPGEGSKFIVTLPLDDNKS
ncbi:MAG: HAMP domain-containing histidine kinase [Butyrivibrio sp.]|nr:HAMP domain-containing histidine kinase [Butyrivibrio sp.]